LSLAQEDNVLKEVNLERDRQERDDLKRVEQPTVPKTTLIPKEIPTLDNNETSSVCFNINKTVLQADIDLLPPLELYTRLEGKCVSQIAIKQLLVDINRFYQKNDLITTRAYVPQQNLRSGELQLTVKGGRLAGFKYSDNSTLDYRLLSAFPIDVNDVINLRDLEQGVDNFNRPSSQEGKMKLSPGEKQGESYLLMEQKRTKPWGIKFNIDNSGYETTGENKFSTNFTFDNLLQRNDTLNLNFNINLDNDHSKRSRNIALSYMIPFGDWLYSYARSYHTFYRTIQGVNQQYYVNGFSESDTFSVQRLLYRDQSTRFYFYSSLALKESKNYIEHYEIRTQRRDLTVLDAGFSGDDVLFKDVQINYAFGMKFGLDEFGGMEEIPGPAIAKSRTLHAKLTARKPFFDQQYTFSTTFAMQHSDDELAGSEQFGVGGRYDVRGFHDDSLYGNSGAYLRNEIETAPKQHDVIKAKFFLGLDMGGVKESGTVSWSDRKIVGASTGVRFGIGKHLSGDLTFSRSLKRPDEFNGKKEQVYMNISLTF
jgi:hemolysin activation/secretion protein